MTTGREAARSPPGVVGSQQLGVVGGTCFQPPNRTQRRSRIRQTVQRKSPTSQDFSGLTVLATELFEFPPQGLPVDAVPGLL